MVKEQREWSSKHLYLWSTEEKNPYRFGRIWQNFHFGVICPFKFIKELVNARAKYLKSCRSCDWYILVYIARGTNWRKSKPLHVSYHVPGHNEPFHWHELLGPHGCHIYPPSSFLSSILSFPPLHLCSAFPDMPIPWNTTSFMKTPGTKMLQSHKRSKPIHHFIFFVVIYIIRSLHSLGLADLNNGSYKFHQCHMLCVSYLYHREHYTVDIMSMLYFTPCHGTYTSMIF